ncbi:MAG: hypothetical protein ACE5D7_09060, partial [Fidelibacterota bacterium]
MKLFRRPIIESFSGSSPLLVRNDFVMFPKTGHMFSIRENNDLIMIKRVLETDKFMTVVLADQKAKPIKNRVPAIYKIG